MAHLSLGLTFKLLARFNKRNPGKIVVQNNSGVAIFLWFNFGAPTDRTDGIAIPSGTDIHQFENVVTEVWGAADMDGAECHLDITQMPVQPIQSR